MPNINKLFRAIRENWRTPLGVQAISIMQYGVKAALKIAVGSRIASGMIRGDGFHNLADILPALIVTAGIWLKKQDVRGYPFKLREIEAILTLFVGLLIGWTGCSIGYNSALGLITEQPRLNAIASRFVTLPHHEAVRVDQRLFWPLVLLMTGSIAASLLTARFQIKVAKACGEPALEADGKETLLDSLVEVTALIGVILVQRLHIVLAEYVLGLVVMLFILHTAWEIITPSVHVMLKRSLGDETEEALRTAIDQVTGVEGIKTLKTFRIGRTMPAALVTVVTRYHLKRHAALRHALLKAIREELLLVDDAHDVEIHLELVEPDPQEERFGYLCQQIDGGGYVIVDEPSQATTLVICEHGDDRTTGRATPYDLPVDIDLVDFCAEKRLKHLAFRGYHLVLARHLAEHDITLKVALFRELATEIEL